MQGWPLPLGEGTRCNLPCDPSSRQQRCTDAAVGLLPATLRTNAASGPLDQTRELSVQLLARAMAIDSPTEHALQLPLDALHAGLKVIRGLLDALNELRRLGARLHNTICLDVVPQLEDALDIQIAFDP